MSLLLFLRGLLFAAAVLLVLAAPHSAWVSVAWVTLLVGAGLAVHVAPRSVLDHPRFDAVIALGDGFIVALAVAGSIADPSLILTLLVTALVGALSSSLFRSGLAGLAAAGAYGALVSLGPLAPQVGLQHALISFPLVALAAPYVWCLAARIEERASAVRTSEQRSEELRSLLEITDAVTGTLDVTRVMHRIVDRVGKQVHADRCSILLVAPKS